MSEKQSTGAEEAIRIAGNFFPFDIDQQESLAMEIISAINKCEAELGALMVEAIRKDCGNEQ